MNVKIKLAVLLLTLSIFSADIIAQCTPNNTYTEYGAYSSLGKNKVPACWIDSAFDETVTIVIPLKYEIATIDKVTLLGVIGLYTGLVYETNTASKLFSAGKNHCIKIHGKPTDINQTNQYYVWLRVFIETDIVDITDTIGINFNLLDSTTLSIDKAEETSHSIYPNPANDLISFDFGGLLYNTISIKLMDLNGKLVKTMNLNSNEENVQLPIEDVENGLYIVKYAIDDKMLFKKITIQH